MRARDKAFPFKENKKERDAGNFIPRAKNFSNVSPFARSRRESRLVSGFAIFRFTAIFCATVEAQVTRETTMR